MKRERIAPAMVCAVLHAIGQAKAAGRDIDPFEALCCAVWARAARLLRVRL